MNTVQKYMKKYGLSYSEDINYNHPKHYNQGSIECIDAIQTALTEEQFIGFLRGNVIKYHWRLGNKDTPLQEVEKGLWYANKLKEVLQNAK